MRILQSMAVVGVLTVALESAHAACVIGAAGVAPAASLSFTAPTLNTDGTPVTTPLTYNVYQSTVSGLEIKVASGATGSPIAITIGLTPRTTYYFKVSVTDAGGNESALSNEVCKTFVASVPGTVTITITQNAPANTPLPGA